LQTPRSRSETPTRCSDRRLISEPWTSCRTKPGRRLFPPGHTSPQLKWKNKGPQKTSHQTVNGRIEFRRSVYWNQQAGTLVPLDRFLGIAGGHSVGVREMACRLGLDNAFVPASANLLRLAQLSISPSALRDLVEREGRTADQAMAGGAYGPDWTAADCTQRTVISGADGVMVPMVTEQQKIKRRQSEAQKRQREARHSTAGRGRPRTGSDGPYKEFKIASFYDPDKSHKYALGTSGDHDALGRLMRRQAAKVRLTEARHKYSVTDGAEWIAHQYRTRLPMLERNILDYYHLREHVTAAGQALYGEGTARAQAWREEMMGHVWERGSLVMLDRLGNYLRRHPRGPRRQALADLRQYVAKRVDMTDYPSYRQAGYDCGSGPTESFCKTLTARLKGRGMRWDKDNAQAVMALGSLYYSDLWTHYWTQQRAA
jgi:hypothetical protein